ncbi:hypothetical protein FACS1894191_3710 [Clostridia bacterium]|nr:hypothetical protein FACS1894191_3710 [Clostridia bacterium]
MAGQIFKLTFTDRAILSSYSHFAEGIAEYLGSGYEIVIHSLESLEHSVIKIINGFHTGRAEGAPITDLALKMLSEIEAKGQNAGGVSYFAQNKNGEPLKSATIPLRGERGRIIGLLCINFYMNTPLVDLLMGMAAPQSSMARVQKSELFVDNSDDLISETVDKVYSEVFADASIPANCKNKEIVRLLQEYGIFNLKEGVPRVAELLNVSKNTVYMHIRNLR